MKAGIDTLQLAFESFEVMPENSLQLVPGTIDLGTGNVINEHYLATIKGREVHGSRLYANGENYQFSIQVKGAGKNLRVLAFYKASLPKMVAENNFRELQESEYLIAYEKILADLEQIGIKTDLDEAKMSRVDFFKNIKLQSAFCDYEPVFRALKAKRMNKQEFGGTGFVCRNSQAEFVGYDKAEEMRRKYESLKFLKDVIRFEARLKNHRKISAAIKTKTFIAILNLLPELTAIYNRLFREAVFSKNVDEYIPDILISESRTATDMLKVFESAFGRNWFSSMLKFNGVLRLHDGFEIPQIKEAVHSMDLDRNKTWRIMRELDRVIKFGGKVSNDERVKIKEKFVEVRDKVLSD